jgi:hypothetical protein
VRWLFATFSQKGARFQAVYVLERLSFSLLVMPSKRNTVFMETKKESYKDSF